MKQDESFFPQSGDIRFISPPKKLKMSDYKDVRNQLINHFSTSKDVLSLYEFGTVNAPSISDIDLMLVLKDHPSDKIHSLIERSSISPMARYLMMDNTLMIVNEKGFKNIPMWDDMSLNRLYGKNIEGVVIPKEDELFIEIARVMDWLPERTMRMVELLVRREIPTRATLCLINSFIYVLQRLRISFDLKFEEADEYISTFNRLRSDWFDIDVKDRHEILYTYLKQGICFGFKAINLFDEYCAKERFYNNDLCPDSGIFRLNPKITSWTTKKMFYNFSNDSRFITAKESFERSIESKSSVIVIPVSYYQHILSYGMNKKTISNKIFKSINPPGDDKILERMNQDLRKVLDKRIQIIDDMGLFFK